jgi:hypothetical protein
MAKMGLYIYILYLQHTESSVPDPDRSAGVSFPDPDQCRAGFYLFHIKNKYFIISCGKKMSRRPWKDAYGFKICKIFGLKGHKNQNTDFLFLPNSCPSQCRIQTGAGSNSLIEEDLMYGAEIKSFCPDPDHCLSLAISGILGFYLSFALFSVADPGCLSRIPDPGS